MLWPLRGIDFLSVYGSYWLSEISREATKVIFRAGKYQASFYKNSDAIKNPEAYIQHYGEINYDYKLSHGLINLLDCANYECPGEERVCLLESERCNTVEDCQDGSDELNCGKENKLN